MTVKIYKDADANAIFVEDNNGAHTARNLNLAGRNNVQALQLRVRAPQVNQSLAHLLLHLGDLSVTLLLHHADGVRGGHDC